jgi:hypothetical protein
MQAILCFQGGAASAIHAIWRPLLSTTLTQSCLTYSTAFSFNPEAANMLNKLAVDIISVGLDVSYISDGVKSHFSGLDFR